VPTFQLAADPDPLRLQVQVEDLVHQGELGPPQPGGDAGADLGGVPVYGLLAAEDDGNLFLRVQPEDGFGQDVAGGKGVRTAEHPVGQEHCTVHTQGQRLSQSRLSIGGAHGDGAHGKAEGVLQTQALLQGVGVVGVYDERDPLSYQGVSNRVYLYLRRVRYLLDTGDYLHALWILLWL